VYHLTKSQVSAFADEPRDAQRHGPHIVNKCGR